jgi:hypothetical protein
MLRSPSLKQRPKPNVILSEAELQRSGRNPRGQAFNVRSFLTQSPKPELDQRCFATLNMTVGAEMRK